MLQPKFKKEKSKEGEGYLAGRRKSFSTAAKFSAACDKYFSSISRTVTALDGSGKPITNDDGEPIKYTEYVIPPSISALCLFIGIERSTFRNYENEKNSDKYPGFREVCQHCRDRIECWLETEVNTRRKGLQGIIFNLKNNYGWRDKTEIELGEGTLRQMEVSSVSFDDKLAAINEAAELLREIKGDDKQSDDEENSHA